MNDPNTKTRHVAIQTSIAFVNDTAGMASELGGDRGLRPSDVDAILLEEGHGWHVAQMHRTLRGYRQHRQDTERDARRHRLQVDPE